MTELMEMHTGEELGKYIQELLDKIESLQAKNAKLMELYNAAEKHIPEWRAIISLRDMIEHVTGDEYEKGVGK